MCITHTSSSISQGDRTPIDNIIKYHIEHWNHTLYSNTLAVPETKVSYRVYSLSTNYK